jgi:hypothetical protein
MINQKEENLSHFFSSPVKADLMSESTPDITPVIPPFSSYLTSSGFLEPS